MFNTEVKNKNELNGTLPLKLFKKDKFVIAFIVYDFGTKKESKKFYTGRITKVGVDPQKNQIQDDFLHQIPKINSQEEFTGFAAYNIRFICNVDLGHILQHFKEPAFERRERYFFYDKDITCQETLQ